MFPAVLYFPAGHAVPLAVAVPGGQYLPATGTHGVKHVNDDVAPRDVLYVPAGHPVQESAPLTSLYSPGGHSVHDADPDTLYSPAAHVPEQLAVVRPATVP